VTRGRRALLILGGALMMAQVGLGLAWWAADLDTVPAYGDTVEYLRLAGSLQVDSYRTVFYPAVLRGAGDAAGWLHLPLAPVVYGLQAGVALAATLYLLSTLWAITAARPAGAGLGQVRPGVRRLTLTLLALVLLTLPVVAHFSDTLLSDSLAASLLVAAVAAVVRIAVLGDVRLRTLALALLCATGAELARPEKIYVLAPVVAAVLLGTLITRRGPRGVRAAALLTVAVVPAIAVTGINRATQTADLGRPPLTTSAMLFNRTAWPRLEAIRPHLPADVRAVISAADARAVDADNNQVTWALARLRAAAGGGDRLVDEVTRTALSCCWRSIALATAAGVGRYSAPVLLYPIDLATGDATATPWMQSRMEMAHPQLTRALTGASIAVLALVELPLLIVWLVRAVRRPRARPHGAAATVAVVVGVVLLNALVFAGTSGAVTNIRYALPSFILLSALLLWADLAALRVLVSSDPISSEAG